MITEMHICVCNKMCTSKAGLVLHQRYCEAVQVAIKEGKPTTIKSDVNKVEIDLVPEVAEIVGIVDNMSLDAHKAITEGNKSAGRRARGLLNDLKHKITPLRKKILDNMHVEEGEEPEVS